MVHLAENCPYMETTEQCSLFHPVIALGIVAF